MKGQVPAAIRRTTCSASDAIIWLMVGSWSVRSRAAAQSTSGGVVDTAVVALDDDDGSSVRRVRVGFDTGVSIAFQVRESAWPSRITLSLNRVAQRTLTIPLVVTHVGGATAADYTGIPASVTFGPDQRRVGFRVYGTLDEEIETGEGLRIEFGTLPPGVRVDSRGSYETVEFVDTSTDVAATNDSDRRCG